MNPICQSLAVHYLFESSLPQMCAFKMDCTTKSRRAERKGPFCAPLLFSMSSAFCFAATGFPSSQYACQVYDLLFARTHCNVTKLMAPPSAFCSRSRRCLCFYATCFRLLPLAAPKYNLIFLVRAGCVADHAHMFFFSVDVRLAVAEKLSTMLLRGKLRGVWHLLLLLRTARMQLVAQPASS